MADSNDKKMGLGHITPDSEVVKKKKEDAWRHVSDKNSLKGFLLAKLRQSQHPINMQ